MTQPPQSRPPRIHFSGIGGTAMVAGARLALEAGCEVRGSDNPLYPPTSHMVEALGVSVAHNYDPANLDWNPDLIIIGNALSRGNPEVEAALDRKLHYLSLPEWLKDNVLRTRRPIAICGTHGKTTTTALTAFALDRCGLQPGYLIGGQPMDFQHSAHLGPPNAPFVIEGDEYDTAFFDKRPKFLHYLPEIAVVTSIEFDHADIYNDIDAIELAFQRMLRQIPKAGWLLACADDPRAHALTQHAFSQTTTYGFAQDADWRGECQTADGHSALTIHHQGAPWARIQIPLAGRHNLTNAIAAIAVAGILGAQPRQLEAAMPHFRGVRRRMEIFHQANGITFIDDFAHHPTAIRETIAAARARWPKHRLWVLFEPRSNTVVTNQFQDQIRDALAGADELWIGPLHRAESIPQDQRLDRATITQQLTNTIASAQHTDDVDHILTDVTTRAATGDVILIMSNGAFGGIYQKLRQAFPHNDSPE